MGRCICGQYFGANLSCPEHAPVGRPWPRLTEELGPAFRMPNTCQRCGTQGELDEDVLRWEEHDDMDRPEGRVVLLCQVCSDLVVEKHRRLYRQLAEHEPMPGAMPLCEGCQYQEGVECTHPDLRRNGGNGLKLSYPEPTLVHVQRRGRGGRARRSGYEKWYRGPVERCEGRDRSR